MQGGKFFDSFKRNYPHENHIYSTKVIYIFEKQKHILKYRKLRVYHPNAQVEEN